MALVCRDNRSRFVWLGIPEPCAGSSIVRQTSFAGGLGAGLAPSGEREGQSPLAVLLSRSLLARAESVRKCQSAHAASAFHELETPNVPRRRRICHRLLHRPQRRNLPSVP